MRIKPIIGILIGMLIAACSQTELTRTEKTAVAGSVLNQLGGTQTAVVLALTPTITPRPSSTPTETPTPLPTNTPTPTMTPTWIQRSKGEVIAPILLYHHIRDGEKAVRYDIPVEVFRRQMEDLRAWGYTSITVSQMVEVIKYGGMLPERPVIITFDDGDLDVYENAFPIMRELGFVGTFYIVTNRLESKDFVTVDHLKEMLASGWEIGSHSHSHLDLVQNHDSVNTEAKGSKVILQDKLGVPVNTFAYPFGSMDSLVANSVASYGYEAAMGLGTFSRHTLGNVFYLSRLEVRGDRSYDEYVRLLPWTPALTPTP